MSIAQFEQTPADSLEPQEPIFVFFKVSQHMEALPRGLPKELAQVHGGDLHSGIWVAKELDDDFGVPVNDYERRMRILDIHKVLEEKMLDSIAAERSVFLDIFLRIPDTRKPYIEAAHSLGAEVVALNILLSNGDLRAARNTGLDSSQRREAERMRKSRFKRARTGEGIDHVLEIQDYFQHGRVLKQINRALDQSRQQKARQQDNKSQ